MAQVSLSIGGYTYAVSCRDGEESHLQRLGQVVDVKAKQAAAAVGGVSEVRQLLMASLLLADQVEETSAAPSQAKSSDPTELERLADRLEALANSLENGGR
jgi:cell division protein ZapA